MGGHLLWFIQCDLIFRRKIDAKTAYEEQDPFNILRLTEDVLYWTLSLVTGGNRKEVQFACGTFRWSGTLDSNVQLPRQN